MEGELASLPSSVNLVSCNALATVTTTLEAATWLNEVIFLNLIAACHAMLSDGNHKVFYYTTD